MTIDLRRAVALAAVLPLALVLLGCPPEEPTRELPELPPPETDPILPPAEPCGTLEIERVKLNAPRAIGSVVLRFTCRENRPGVCEPGACEPCWTQSDGRFVLSCICDGLCNPPDWTKPPRPEDFEPTPTEPLGPEPGGPAG